jgi:hypothetical protein
VNELHVPVDLIVMGKKSGSGIYTLLGQSGRRSKRCAGGIRKENARNGKISFLQYLKSIPADWENTKLLPTPLKQAIDDLKKQPEATYHIRRRTISSLIT